LKTEVNILHFSKLLKKIIQL